MFGFLKKMCGCECSDKDKKSGYEKRLEAAHKQDKRVRESLSEKEIDKGLKDTMEASDPVAKY